MSQNYTIVRKYFNDRPDEKIQTGLTLKEVKEHCSDIESSSKTCTSKAGRKRTEKFGPWFDSAYEE